MIRAQATLLEHRPLSPSRAANSARNARAAVGRHRRWAPARKSLWRFLDPHLGEGARVLIVGAGNGDDLPLPEIAARASQLTLLDLDSEALKSARRTVPMRLRRRVETVEDDATEGAADAVAAAAALDRVPAALAATEAPLRGGGYDLAIGDLLYSQLLYPALLDLGVDAGRLDAFIARFAPALTRSVVARLHASAPLVCHLHDPLAWWEGHEQPVDLDRVLRLAEDDDVSIALSEVERGRGPSESDPRVALRDLGIADLATSLWVWPFSEGVDYLVCATLAGALPTG